MKRNAKEGRYSLLYGFQLPFRKSGDLHTNKGCIEQYFSHNFGVGFNRIFLKFEIACLVYLYRTIIDYWNYSAEIFNNLLII